MHSKRITNESSVLLSFFPNLLHTISLIDLISGAFYGHLSERMNVDVKDFNLDILIAAKLITPHAISVYKRMILSGRKNKVDTTQANLS